MEEIRLSACRMYTNHVNNRIFTVSTGAGFLPSAVAPENGWLEDGPWVWAYYQGRTVSFREGKATLPMPSPPTGNDAP